MEPVWLKQYMQDVPADIELAADASLLDLIEKSLIKYADRVAYINYGSKLTYANLDRLSRQFANFLRYELKLKPGSHIALMLPNIFQYPVAMLGVLRAGMIVINVNPLYTAHELADLFAETSAEVVVAFAHCANTLEKALPQSHIKHVILTQIGDLMAWPKSSLFNFTAKYVKRLVPDYHLPQAISFNSVFSKGEKYQYQSAMVTANDMAFLQYTGGTTGQPKGAMLSQRNLAANIMQCLTWVTSVIEPDGEMALGALPLYHIFALTVSLVFLTTGTTVLLITDPRDMQTFLRALKSMPLNIYVGINTLFNGLMNQEKFKNLDFSQLKLVLAGGMPLQADVAERWHRLTAVPITEGYGLTEASPVVALNPLNLEIFNGSIGLPLPSTMVSIRNDAGEEVAIGEAGELWIKGPQVMQGYWQREEETREVIQDGWLRSGDMARIDQQGFIYIVDRKKDMILVSGFNVYPNEIEDNIMRMPAVKEVAVVGLPSEKTGEMVVAVVVKKAENLSAEIIMQHCRDCLTGYKVPKRVVFLGELPKNNVGKVLRRELRQQLLAMPA
ncbi:MAG: AMP-binding protein [Gammaproteobacteria bacterium]|nr:AMP-binding protein [Gammaproteobacteria bacterium]